MWPLKDTGSIGHGLIGLLDKLALQHDPSGDKVPAVGLEDKTPTEFGNILQLYYSDVVWKNFVNLVWQCDEGTIAGVCVRLINH